MRVAEEPPVRLRAVGRRDGRARRSAPRRQGRVAFSTTAAVARSWRCGTVGARDGDEAARPRRRRPARRARAAPPAERPRARDRSPSASPRSAPGRRGRSASCARARRRRAAAELERIARKLVYSGAALAARTSDGAAPHAAGASDRSKARSTSTAAQRARAAHESNARLIGGVGRRRDFLSSSRVHRRSDKIEWSTLAHERTPGRCSSSSVSPPRPQRAGWSRASRPEPGAPPSRALAVRRGERTRRERDGGAAHRAARRAQSSFSAARSARRRSEERFAVLHLGAAARRARSSSTVVVDHAAAPAVRTRRQLRSRPRSARGSRSPMSASAASGSLRRTVGVHLAPQRRWTLRRQRRAVRVARRRRAVARAIERVAERPRRSC